MTVRRSTAGTALDAVYVVAVIAVWALAAWAYVHFVAPPDVDTLSVKYDEGRTLEMLSPRWLAVALVVPALWLLRKWSLSDLPWLQQLLNVTLRSLIVLSLCLAATQIVITEYDSHVSTVVLVDVSESVPDSLIEAAQKHIQSLYDARGENELRVITFAKDAHEVPIAPGAQYVPVLTRHSGGGAGLESNLDTALRLAYGLFPTDHLKRALIISDGNLNRGDVLSEAYNAARYGVRLYSRALDYEREDEVLIREVDFPENILANEPFHIVVDVFSTYDGEIRLDMTQNEFRDIRGRRFDVRAGQVEQLDIVAEVYEPGRRTFEIEIDAEPDRFSDNNRIVHTIEVAGRPQVLYVEGESRRRTYLQRALDDERNPRVNFDLDVRTSGGFPSNESEMELFDLIILSDVEARSLSRSAMSALERYVRGGGSFLMVGGENSFGPGGYAGTTMEDLLPVTFEGRRRESMPSVALMIAIDRSGSMDGIKLEMAKDAARATVELLGPQDQVGVIAFDTDAREIVGLQSASNRARIQREIGRITIGGGTDVYPALETAYLDLVTTRARVKHVILLTDGEAPYEGIPELVSQMRADRISVSTVGVGSDADRTLLEMIADISGGRSYYTRSAQSIPQIFIQETNQVTRTNFVEEPFRPVVESNSPATRGIDFSTVPYLLGYVSTRAKNGATVSLETEQGDPLYAFWRYGRGRAAVFTSDCKNRWMVEWVRDPVYPRFWAQVARHLMRNRRSDDETMEMDVSVVAGHGVVAVDAIGDDDSFINGLESVVSVTGPDGETEEITLSQQAAGRYEARFDLASYGSYLLEGMHRLDGADFAVSLASLSNPYPDEYLAVADDQSVIEQAVAVGGGETQPSIEALFDPGDEKTPSERDIWPFFVFAALGLLIVDVLFRRVRVYGRTALDWGKVTKAR